MRGKTLKKDTRMVKNIIPSETKKLRDGYYLLDYQFQRYQKPLMEKGWSFYVVDQDGGYCRYGAKEITIPLWLITGFYKGRKVGGKISTAKTMQYVLHEIAHAMIVEKYGFAVASTLAPHGKEFMGILINISPPETLIYEMIYKPKNLVAAGAVFCGESLDF
jgi:hypothetical protein